MQAWIDTWGNHPAIQLIDLGGRKNPLEYVYTERVRIKKILPVTRLNLAGVGCANLSTPRSEYNNIADLILRYETFEGAGEALSNIGWQEFVLTDVVGESSALNDFMRLAKHLNAEVFIKKEEPAYHVIADSFENYVMSLGGNTRLKYFNRRGRLASHGTIERKTYASHEIDIFFAVLNEFHLARWGKPCYSKDSQNFMRNFQERLMHLGGQAIMEALSVNGEIVSVIYDVVWAGKRYNFQSGYAENRFPKIALGALHLGYSIEAAVQNEQVYDFMAGYGKNTAYKAHIANSLTTIKTISLQRSYVKAAKRFYDLWNRQ